MSRGLLPNGAHFPEGLQPAFGQMLVRRGFLFGRTLKQKSPLRGDRPCSVCAGAVKYSGQVALKRIQNLSRCVTN